MHMHEKRLDRLLDEQSDLRGGKQAAHIAGKKATSLNLSHTVHKSAEIAEAERLTKRFDQRVLLNEASFLVRGGEKVGIIGDNGCGKTTLLRMLLGVDTDFTGVCRLGPWVKYALLDQNAVFDDESRTALDEIIAAKEMPPPLALRELARVGLYGEEAEKRISVLSGGERVRLKLCLAMLHKPDCLVLDEPTNHLDLPAREAFETALRGFQGSVLAVSHDRYFLTTSVSRLLVFKQCKIESFKGNYDDYRLALEAAASGQSQAQAGQKAGVAAKPRSEPNREPSREPTEKQTTSSTPSRGKSNEQALAALETRIVRLEMEKADLEARFGEDKRGEIFAEYGKLERELDQLNGEWETLAMIDE